MAGPRAEAIGRGRLAALVLLLPLAALQAFRAEASRTGVWESNPPASFSAARTEAASALASLAPAAVADIEAAEPARFDLGDVILAERELEHGEHFNLGPLTLVDLNLLRGPPPSYPETRVGGFELLPPFRVGASPSLSLWSRRACGSISCGLVSDSPEDPWGLMSKKEQEAFDRRQQKLIEMASNPCYQPGASCMGAGPSSSERQEFDEEQAAIAQNNREAYRWKLALVDVPNTIPALGAPAAGVYARANHQGAASGLRESLPARVSNLSTSGPARAGGTPWSYSDSNLPTGPFRVGPDLVPAHEPGGRRRSNVSANKVTGDAHEVRVGHYLRDTRANVTEQVSIRPNTADGPAAFRFRIDFLANEPTDGSIVGTEAKGSDTARLRTNQKRGFELVRAHGGTVVGEAGGEAFPPGTVLPPGTDIGVTRPGNLPPPY